MINLVPDIPDEARKWRNNPAIYKWCRQHTPNSADKHLEWKGRIEGDPTIRMFGIEAEVMDPILKKPDSPRPVGVCGLTSIDMVNRKAEFSLYIGPEHQRNGYGTEALKALLDWGFDTLGLRRIWGEVFAGNPAFKKFELLGFSREGWLKNTYFKDGNFIDSYIIALMGEERTWH